MALISAEDRQTLQTFFSQELQNDVSITCFTQHESVLTIPGQECAYCKDTRELLEEVVAISDKLHLTVKDFVRDEQEAKSLGVERIPAIVLQGQAKGIVRFYGVPAGYEFTTLIEDLADVSKGTTDLSEKTRQKLAEIDRDLHVQVFVTPTCPYCPRAARLAHKLAIENPHITADVVEISEFIDLAQRYHVQGVPKTVVNEHIEFVGAQPEPRFMQEVLNALHKQKK
jgi:glutaredoxin-like protein